MSFSDPYNIIVGASGAASSVTGTVNETTLYTSPTIKGITLGINEAIRCFAIFSYTNSANNKVLRLKFNATNAYGITQTVTSAVMREANFMTRGTVNTQVGPNAGITNAFGTSNNAVVQIAATLNTDFTITVTGQLANSGETITLESVFIKIIKKS